MQPPPAIDLKELLLGIVQNQHEFAVTLVSLRADLETLTLTLSLIAPQFAESLGKALEVNRLRYVQDLANRRAELELIRAKVSNLVQ